MTKFELKSIISECIQEIVQENQYPQPRLLDPSQPEGPDNPMLTSDDIINIRLQKAKEYAANKKDMSAIQKDVGTKDFTFGGKDDDAPDIDMSAPKKDKKPELPVGLKLPPNKGARSVDSLKELKKKINEAIEEVVDDSKSIAADMEELEKAVKSQVTDATIEKDDAGNYNINDVNPHKFSIRPVSTGKYNVLYFKDNTDRTKKLNLTTEELKKFIEEKLKSKDLTYTKTAFNKIAKNSEEKKDENKDVGLHDYKPKLKEPLKDTKNEYKDYYENMVKNEKDMPDKPFREIDTIKKQLDHPIKGTKPDYTYPKQKDKKLVVKGKSKGKLKKLGGK